MQPKKGPNKNGLNRSGPKIKPKNNNGAIAIQFVINGHTYKFNPIHRGKFDNDLDMAKAKNVCQQIEMDLLTGHFDSSLNKYRAIRAIKAGKSDRPDDDLINFSCFDLYLEYLGANDPTREDYSQNISQTKRALGKVEPSLHGLNNAYDMLVALRKIYALSTLNRVFVELRTAVNWHIKCGKDIKNPYSDIVSEIKKQLSKNPTGKSKRAATAMEVETIINAFRTNAFSSPKAPKDNHSYYTNFVRFLFATGCRPEDARAVTWDDILTKKDKKYICFSKASPIPGVVKPTKNATIRLFPVNEQLQEILDDAYHQNQAYKLEDSELIFPSKEGKRLDGRNFQSRHFKVIVDGLVASGQISKPVTQGNGRHSFITTMRTKGLPDSVIAALVETSPDMIDSHYSDDNLLTDIDLPKI